MPNGLGPRPEKLFMPVETGGPKMDLGFSGLRLESMAGLSYDGVDAEDLNPPLFVASSGGRASAPNVPVEDAIERSYVGVVNLEPNSFGKGDGLFSTITRYEAQVISNGENHASVTSPSSSPFFGRALLLGSSSGLGVSSASEFDDDKRPLRMVTANKRE